MIGLDTNVILRYMLQDDTAQSKRAARIIESELSPENPGYINLCTVLEIFWVLRSGFRQSPSEVATYLESLLAVESFVVQNQQEVFEAISASRDSIAEFEDALIGAVSRWAGCSFTYTFDRGTLRLPHFRVVA